MTRTPLFASISLVALLLASTTFAADAAKPRPLMKDFMGINGHTVQFKPELYKAVCKLVRDYHPMVWDVTAKDTSAKTTFPMAENKVSWQEVYGSWVKAGFEIDACLQFESIKKDAWKNLPADTMAYGKAFAEYFGPSGKAKLVTSAEIGNEPADYDDATYRSVFENMAKGIREGDPKLKIVTCAIQAGKPDKYSKGMEVFKGLESLYDVLNVHVYSFVEGWPTWKRSFPEDSNIEYLKVVQRTINWRNTNAKDKEIWITEFGYDATTKPNATTGDFAKWEGVSDEVQAQWIVRSFLVFSAMDVDRAYLYFFNDEDAPSLHGASGITRDFKPKPSFWAMKHLYQSLGDYRFFQDVQRKKDDLYVYEYVKGDDLTDRVWVVWSPTGAKRQEKKTLDLPGEVVKAERMPLEDGPAEQVDVKDLTVTESPVYIWLKVSEQPKPQ